MSETVFATSRWRSAPSCENDLCLGDMGNYWQKQLWLTRRLRGPYAEFPFQPGNKFGGEGLEKGMTLWAHYSVAVSIRQYSAVVKTPSLGGQSFSLRALS